MATSRQHRSWCLRVPAVALGAMVTLAAFGLAAQDARFFRIGTGFTGGTYFPIGALIANAVSHPPGSRPCEQGGSCGVPGLIAVAVSTIGSVSNVEAVAAGELESGLSQADVAYWAQSGTGIYRNKEPLESLRAVANLYPEAVQVVVRADSGIEKIADLRGKRVSLGEKGSGTLVDAEIVLRGYGLSAKSLKASYLKLGQSVDMLANGTLDGFFFVSGAPSAAIADLAQRAEIRLVPIDGDKAAALVEKYRFFAAGEVPADTYNDVPATPTLTVGAQWIVSAELEDELVYGLTRALWHENTRALLDEGHPKGSHIRLENALTGVAVPLHPGAERYYREAGILAEEPASRPTEEVRPKAREMTPKEEKAAQ